MRKILIAIPFILALFTGCRKEYDDNLGTVNISFERIDNKPIDWVVKISTVENTNVAIYSATLSASSTKVQVRLLPGNYVVSAYSSHNPHRLFSDVSFQLAANKTYDIWYDYYWKGHTR